MDTRSSEIVVEKPSKPKRRWIQFSLRTLLLMMLVFGCGLGWVAFERKKNARLQADIEAIRELGGEVHFDYSLPIWTVSLSWLLGDNSFRKVAEVNFFPFADVLTDAGLEHLKGLAQLELLRLDNNKITDAGLEHLIELTQLQMLSLVGTRITDAGLEHLKGLKQLAWLDLRNTKITDAGLEHLKGLTQLSTLRLNNTKTTDAGLDRLKMALPNCEIVK